MSILIINVAEFEKELLPLISKLNDSVQCLKCGSVKVSARPLIDLLRNKDNYPESDIPSDLLSKILEIGPPNDLPQGSFNRWVEENEKYFQEDLGEYYGNFVLLRFDEVIFKLNNSCSCYKSDHLLN